ncbi:hypothetical protein Plhal304r1_c062g0149121 [Plasmopara halstedii]
MVIAHFLRIYIKFKELMRANVCSRSASMARQVVSVVRCFAKRKHNQRDELKTSTGSRLARASAASFRMSMDDANVGDDEPESGDEDILISLPTSCRAWRVYHREKRAHDYTKRRLVATFQRETKLLKLVASIDGRVEVVERTAMEMADLEAAMMRFEMKLDTQVQELVMQNDLILKLEASKAQCQFYKERLYETNATLLKYRGAEVSDEGSSAGNKSSVCPCRRTKPRKRKQKKSF